MTSMTSMTPDGGAPDRMSALLESFGQALDRSRDSRPACQPAVKPTLTPPAKRRRRSRPPLEATDTAAMLRRMLRAQGERVANADVEDLADLIGLQVDLDNAIAHAVSASRARHARSWSDIGRAAGVTRQAAQAKWGTR